MISPIQREGKPVHRWPYNDPDKAECYKGNNVCQESNGFRYACPAAALQVRYKEGTYDDLEDDDAYNEDPQCLYRVPNNQEVEGGGDVDESPPDDRDDPDREHEEGDRKRIRHADYWEEKESDDAADYGCKNIFDIESVVYRIKMT